MADIKLLETVPLIKRAGKSTTVVTTECLEAVLRPQWSPDSLPPFIRQLCMRMSAHHTMDPLMFLGPVLVGFAGLLGPHARVHDGLSVWYSSKASGNLLLFVTTL